MIFIIVDTLMILQNTWIFQAHQLKELHRTALLV